LAIIGDEDGRKEKKKNPKIEDGLVQERDP
jgi:hypothetical protein